MHFFNCVLPLYAFLCGPCAEFNNLLIIDSQITPGSRKNYDVHLVSAPASPGRLHPLLSAAEERTNPHFVPGYPTSWRPPESRAIQI